MADFCRQCSLMLFGEDFGNLKGLISKEQVDEGLVVSVICEGCGPTQVNHLGECVDVNCYEKHGEDVQK